MEIPVEIEVCPRVPRTLPLSSPYLESEGFHASRALEGVLSHSLAALVHLVQSSDLLPVFSVDLGVKLVLAVVLGGIVGLERELLEKPAGLRTNILICLGAAIFTHLSSYVAIWGSPTTPADPSRIASQIVSGIGFLGAGAIIQSRAHVKGLTTAATIWVVAAIGMAVGAGAYGLAGGGTILILLILVGLGALERRIAMGWAEIEVVVELKNDAGALARIQEILQDRGLEPSLQEVSREPEEEKGRARIRGRIANADLQEVVQELFRIPEILKVQPK